MPPEDATPSADGAGTADALAGEAPETDRSGLPDWLWVPLLTVTIAAALVTIGRATFVA